MSSEAKPDERTSNNNTMNEQNTTHEPPFEYPRRRNNNNNYNMRAQLEELKNKVSLQEEALRNMGAVFSSLSALREHGYETNRDRRNFNYNNSYQHGVNNNGYPNNRRGRAGSEN